MARSRLTLYGRVADVLGLFANSHVDKRLHVRGRRRSFAADRARQSPFDTDDDPIPQDFEFTRANGCTDEVHAAKRANLAAVLNQLHDGNGPELLGVAEVERVGASSQPGGKWLSRA